jgi:hypothetical protein
VFVIPLRGPGVQIFEECSKGFDFPRSPQPCRGWEQRAPSIRTVSER